MLHSPLDNEYLTMKYFPQSHQLLIGSLIFSSNLTPVKEKYILSCHIFLPTTVLNPGEYTARSGVDIIRISVKLIENASFFLGMRLLQSTLTGFVSKENMSIHYNTIKE